MSLEATIRLLLVDRPQADPQPVLKPLRAAGFLVRHWQVERIDLLQKLVDDQVLDLIVVHIAEGVPRIEDVRDSVDSAFKDIPLIAVVEGEGMPDAVHLLSAGADRIASLDIADSLPMVARLELGRLNERRQARRWEGLYREAEARAQALLETSRDAIAYIHAGAHIYANPTYRALFHYEDDLLDTTLIDLVHRDDRTAIKAYLRACERAGAKDTPEGFDCRGLRADGSEIQLHMRASPARMNEEFCLQLVVREAADDSEVQDRLRYLTEHDPLTGLFNRQYFAQVLNRVQMAAMNQGQTSGAVLYILLTDYRGVAERLGLEAVDDLLRGVAHAIESAVTPHEIIARFSDATFTVYTPQPGRSTVTELGERIRISIETHSIRTGEKMIAARASIGICMIGDTNASATQIIVYADKACEQARQLGGTQVQVYTPVAPERDSIARRDSLLHALRRAIADGRVYLQFQPIASFQSDPLERYQVRVAAIGDDGAPLDMREALPLAETRGLLVPFDRWVIASALGTLSTRREQGHPIAQTLFIPLSTNTILDKEFPGWLLTQLTSLSLEGSVLVLEVAEGAVEPYFTDLLRVKQAVEKAGCHLALEHFGEHPSSAQLLRELKPAYAKLGFDLIERASHDSAAAQSAHELADLAHSLEVRTIACDVDNAAAMAAVWQFGITLIEGDLVQAPGAEMNFDFRQFIS
ncbi:EAL domain-containing protein [Plasticicumulans acidivorans]|uniref:PAS domain S-box-containing protein/diguanylate cyclase (GGDEF)-like protein n=1 Tax=Plasticicumulans acidivorans TaxID=886464 RepID=A0A317MZU5_9GAMM|nr:EAL domain-containing protein [Plasticicumulans acidivorans]PWV65832.1 PAS domain S-box-containing protein/diguanylate cyclase (GGDEF)-like protein [Plasticicumulans acidivorans]